MAENRLYYGDNLDILQRYVTDETVHLEAPVIPPLDVIADISPLNNVAAERPGYPAQKPVALLERFIQASSHPGDTIIDPFCGCGTTIDVAQRLKRRWVGIDITHLAIALIKHRLQDTYGDQVVYQVVGEPEALSDAVALAAEEPYQFHWWALGHRRWWRDWKCRQSYRPLISADWRDACTIVIIVAGMARHQSCVNGQAKVAAVCCGHCLSAPSVGKRCINPRSDGNRRKPISPMESSNRLAARPAVNWRPIGCLSCGRWRRTMRWPIRNISHNYGKG